MQKTPLKKQNKKQTNPDLLNPLSPTVPPPIQSL